MKLARTSIAGVTAAAVGLLGTSFLLGHLTADAAPSPRPASEVKQVPRDTPTWATSNFPTNASGQTYGSDALAETPADAPDLVAVVGDNGVQGFVHNKHLNLPHFTTLKEAVDWEKDRQAGKLIKLNVYSIDGKEVVDTFTLENGITNEVAD